MSQIKASSEVVRQLASDLKATINNLRDISSQVKSAGNVGDWNDAQGVQFKEVVNRISTLTQSPIQTLEAAIPRLNKIAETLDRYSSVKF
ncbi:MAG: hypothetical protein IJQ07_06745 [Clostridia bacterium]|nr:hypothetical protein [Clostridia bacterium]